MTVKPIFLFSQPRSGSTLLQRILGSHPNIATTPEPWILLPIIHSIKQQGVFSLYDHNSATNAIGNFITRLPDGKQDYYGAVRCFAQDLYQKASGEKDFFLDKTPRYHLIIPEIFEIFPEAKFIFLFRNPLSVLASILATWGSVHIFRVDLFAGLELLVEGAHLIGERAIQIRYEDLVQNPQLTLQKLSAYLKIEYFDELISSFQHFQIRPGEFGNPTKINNKLEMDYSVISSEHVDKWVNILNKNFLRRKYAHNYLRFIGEERLGFMGYEINDLISSLCSQAVAYAEIGSDLIDRFRGMLSVSLETQILREKISLWPDIYHMYAHR